MNKLESEKGDMTIDICPQVSACTYVHLFLLVGTRIQCQFFSLDIIGRVAFGHDFQSGQSPEAKLITDSWNKDVNMGITFAGFLAPFVIGMFPFIASSLGEGVTKRVVSKLAGVILEREEKCGEKGEVTRHRTRSGRSGKDILSLLMQAKRKNNGQGLSNKQIADNVSSRFVAIFR